MDEKKAFHPHNHKRKKEPFSISRRIESFSHGYAGLVGILKTEHNAWVHVVLTIMVLIVSWWLKLEFIEFCLIILAVIIVWVAEAFNTVIEMMVNIATRMHPKEVRESGSI